jgi:uncharacterized repeat protein (TIGR01451 family)
MPINRTALLLLGCLLSVTTRADLAVPAWFDSAWHYRAPLQLPATAAPNSTIVVDVDFNALLSQLGITGTFDVNSPRVVRSSGGLAATQEFTDRVYNGILDAAANARGEVRFLLQDDVAAGSYYLYFDITANGAKPANPATPINGNFEQSVGSTPTSWVVASLNANGAQNQEVHRTGLGATFDVAAGCSSGSATVDDEPARSGATTTGEAWLLLGYRDRCEDGKDEERIGVERSIAVPAGSAAGNLSFEFQIQGWDGISNRNNYDWVEIFVDGLPVDHTALGIDNATTPQLIIEPERMGKDALPGRSGSNSYADHGWKQATLDLAPYAGTTITLRIESKHSASDNRYRAWVKLDDVAWSVQNAILGAPQGFGANVTTPKDTAAGPASVLLGGQAVAINATVDAIAAGVTADLYDNAGTLLRSGIVLYDDGTHGDATAADGVWSNDGSVAAQPTYTILGSDPPGSNWLVRIFARDASTSAIGAVDGDVHRPGQGNTPPVQANFFDVDEQHFTVVTTALEVTKNVVTIRDPVSGTTLPKAVPGAWLQYTVTVTNAGPGSIDGDSVVVLDALPANVALCVTTACSGAATPVEFDDSASPSPTGLTFNYGSNVTFSTDGVSYGYAPVPDANGFDAAVTHVRIAPTGPMSAPGPGGNPQFLLRYVVRIK